MQEQFWREKWIEGQIGFHRNAPHEMLIKNYPVLNLAKNKNVLVPLCGKTLDLLFLRDLGAQVTGVELSEVALDQFEQDNQIKMNRTTKGDYQIRKSEGLELICGNFFGITADTPFDAIYDRAAAIALPQEMRKIYFKKLQELLAPGGNILMIFLNSESAQVPLDFGPPFFIPRQEINEAFSGDYGIEVVDEKQSSEIPDRYREAGVTRISETALKITKRH